MKIGFVGLGKMGANMVQRLLLNGHEVTVYDMNAASVASVQEKGAEAANNLIDIVSKLPERKVVWLMVPAGKPVDDSIDVLLGILHKDDIIIDGGNSNWKESIERSKKTARYGVHYVDCGTSGGLWGLQNGYCLMYGGDKDASSYLEPIFSALTVANGHMYCGKSGSGHFTKMIHNGIEYGMMQSYAEGFEILEKSDFDIDLKKTADLWMQGSVVRSWLLELIGNALEADPNLEGLKPYVADSGEARWTVQAAIDLDVPAPVITSSLFSRFASRNDNSFGLKLVAAMRNQFGGHAVKK
jgi:6-phosphogluconate dehydrogenase